MAAARKGNAVNNELSSNAEVVAAMVGPTTEAGPELAPVPAQAEIPAASSVPIVVRAWQRLRSEPSLLITTAYLFVSFIGLWANYWFYRDFGLPILEYMQASDYLVAGLRDPAYALILLGSILLTLLISGPDVYRHRHPQRVDALRTKWWGRVVFPASRWLRWKAVGLAPETGVAFALFWGMMWATVSYVQDKGRYIREDRAGNLVQVTMAGDWDGDITPKVSVGVACAQGTSRIEDVIKRADQALYAAKAAGRNRVYITAEQEGADDPCLPVNPAA